MNQIATPPKMINKPSKRMRIDLQLVADLVSPNTRVLDVGCGDGTLLSYLMGFKKVDARGLEISMSRVRTDELKSTVPTLVPLDCMPKST